MEINTIITSNSSNNKKHQNKLLKSISNTSSNTTLITRSYDGLPASLARFKPQLEATRKSWIFNKAPPAPEALTNSSDGFFINYYQSKAWDQELKTAQGENKLKDNEKETILNSNSVFQPLKSNLNQSSNLKNEITNLDKEKTNMNHLNLLVDTLASTSLSSSGSTWVNSTPSHRTSMISNPRDSVGSDMGYFSTSPSNESMCRLKHNIHTTEAPSLRDSFISLYDAIDPTQSNETNSINKDTLPSDLYVSNRGNESIHEGFHTARSSLYLPEHIDQEVKDDAMTQYHTPSFDKLSINVEMEMDLVTQYHTPLITNEDIQPSPRTENIEVSAKLNLSSSPLSHPIEEQESIPTNINPEQNHKSSSDEANLQRRFNISQEILHTERTYVAGLDLLREIFYIPLSEPGPGGSPPILDNKRMSDIFSNLMGIVAVNKEFLKRLEERLEGEESWDPKVGLIGDIFCQLAPYFRMYSLYVKNFNSALAVISELIGKNSNFASFLKDKKVVAACKGLPFESYLILPVQRIPRYKMLIEDLLKRTDESHPDYQNLVNGLDIVSKAATFVNEMIRQHEMFMDMLAIQKSLQGFNENLLIPGRKLIKRGILHKICRKNHQPRSFFLFSDILIYASGSTSLEILDAPRVFHRKVDLEAVRVVDVPDNDMIKYCFQILSQDKSFAAYASNEREKQEWVQAIERSVIELKENKRTLKLESKVGRLSRAVVLPLVVSDYSAPVWIPDDQASHCHCCAEEFSVFRRKHHCRLCGNVICHSCSTNTFYIPGQSLVDHRPARACDPCYRTRFKGVNQEHEKAPSGLAALKRYSFLGGTSLSSLTSLGSDSLMNGSISTNSSSSISGLNSGGAVNSPSMESNNSNQPRFPFYAPRRLVELREAFNRDSCFSDQSSMFSYGGDEERSNSTVASRFSRLRSMSGSTAALIGGLTSNEKQCQLCKVEFTVFKWKNACQTCHKIVCSDCLSKKPPEAKPPKRYSQIGEVPQSSASSLIDSGSTIHHQKDDVEEAVQCDPCYLGIAPENVIVNPQGGGWGVSHHDEVESPVQMTQEPESIEQEIKQKIDKSEESDAKVRTDDTDQTLSEETRSPIKNFSAEVNNEKIEVGILVGSEAKITSTLQAYRDR